MTKKILALLLAAMMVLGLAACGNKTDDSSDGDNDSKTEARRKLLPNTLRSSPPAVRARITR